MSAGATLQASGQNTSLTAFNATNIDGAGLSVSGGAGLSLPGVRSYRDTSADGGAVRE